MGGCLGQHLLHEVVKRYAGVFDDRDDATEVERVTVLGERQGGADKVADGFGISQAEFVSEGADTLILASRQADACLYVLRHDAALVEQPGPVIAQLAYSGSSSLARSAAAGCFGAMHD